MFDRLLDILSQGRTLRALVDFLTIVVRLIPALFAVIAFIPAFVVFPFVAAGPRRHILDLVDRLTHWTLGKHI
ncbi:hypothetical protein ACQPZG_20430 [Streptomyces sp. CA-294286]|uniref:hypothetical protein n=1 Tax=unclassified Streptomyces TaxID=2593676 RepID=UPI00224D1287|nr:hypothetical protein [Streptomyces sp. NBC_00237]MCX5206768.1 hypothetical protein [Streptomyces sp. NBC_00237]